jgi:hypothetical protein
MGKPKGIGETREASSETGSAAKTQGRTLGKPPEAADFRDISGDIDRAIKAQAGHDRRYGPSTTAASVLPA